MKLPVSPPLTPMLAKRMETVPDGWAVEPKWDGFRAIVYRDGSEVLIHSRDKKPLNRYFPELEPVLRSALPDRVVLDGEIVIRSGDTLDFSTLQMRIHPAESRVTMLAGEIPASFIAFDLLALGDDDVMSEGDAERRKRLLTLGDIAAEPAEQLPEPLTFSLSPRKDALSDAQGWLNGIAHAGIEGVIGRPTDGIYAPGKRALAKVKVRRTIECVVGGYRIHKSGSGVGSLLLGLYNDAGELAFVGHTSSFNAKERVEVLEKVSKYRADSAFEEDRSPAAPSRWRNPKEQTEWISVNPELVVEVEIDRIEHGRIRHAASFRAWRTDVDPSECTYAKAEVS